MPDIHHTQQVCHPTFVAWVIDMDGSACLCHKNDTSIMPATLTLATNLLSLLKPFEYAIIRPFLVKHDNQPLTNIAISLQGLLRIGIIKQPLNRDCYIFDNQSYQMISYRTILDKIPIKQAHNISHIIQALRWAYDFRYCNHCGTPVHTHEYEYAKICPKCNHHHYPRISPCVIVAIYKNTDTAQILLAKHHHNSQTYGLISGFMEVGESCEDAIIREVKEETGLTIKNIRYIGSQPWPYSSNLMLGFMAEYADGEIFLADNELFCADFFRFDDLPNLPACGTISRLLIQSTHQYLTNSHLATHE